MYFRVRTVLIAIGLSALADSLPARSLSLQLPLSYEVAFTCNGASLDHQSGITRYDAWTDEVVNRHNTFRAQYSAPALSWNSDLYAGTLQWAQQCVFQHSGGNYGENLAAGAGGGYGFASGLQSWMDEASSYDYNNPGFSPSTGHFTQVVWKSTTSVACAMVDCPANTIFSIPSKFIVCRYDPPGNYAGQFPDNVGRHI